MRRTVFRLMLATLALGAPGVAAAQVGGGDNLQSGGVPHHQDIRPMGVQMAMYTSEYTAHFEKDQCGREGCIIIVNKSPAFDIAQLYINDGKTDAHGVPIWGANQFQGFNLHSNRAVWTPKPRKMNCEVTVRVVMHRRDSELEMEGVQPLNLCNMPKAGFAVFEIQADDPDAKGRVTIGDKPGS